MLTSTVLCYEHVSHRVQKHPAAVTPEIPSAIENFPLHASVFHNCIFPNSRTLLPFCGGKWHTPLNCRLC